MKRILTIALGLWLSGGGSAQAQTAAEDLQTLRENFSYLLGVQTGNTLRRDLPQALADIDLEAMLRGIEDRLQGREPSMDVAEMTFWSGRFMQMLEERRSEAGASNVQAGASFRAEYATRDGVRRTPSGMLYRELESGDGAQPGIGQSVRVHYRGTFIDGREFDSSHARGEPATLGLRKVIAGWQEALTMMQVGDRWEVVLPPELAYGESGVGQVGPQETLLFEIQLLDIVDP